ncbi:MAG TPA: beta/gamma crystallin-related protein [Thermoanaerobaculia bacterium]|nr:beta/gamma crystallin-related protein [Thermoanaerobaculia bacterium]
MRVLTRCPLARVVAVVGAVLAIPALGAAQSGTITGLVVTVEDLGSRENIASIAPGDQVQIQAGQKVRLRMTATQARGGTRYPSTKFIPNDTKRILVDATNEEVGTITLTGRQVNEAGGAVPIQYQILEDWPMRDELRKGRVYVQVVAKQVGAQAASVPDALPGGPSRGVGLYADDNFRGRTQFFAASDPDLSNDPIGNDTVSSLKVSTGCVVTLYEDTGYRGRSVRVDADTPSMDRVGFRNDALSSLKLECSNP